MPPFNKRLRPLAGLAIALTLAGCSDIYYDRRETVVPWAGDAVAANKVAQMVDPWPRNSANKDIAFSGERMQAASERYRQGRVIPPVNATTSSVAYQQAQQAASANSGSTPQSGSWSPPPTPTVK
jgi:hypothetical protein